MSCEPISSTSGCFFSRQQPRRGRPLPSSSLPSLREGVEGGEAGVRRSARCHLALLLALLSPDQRQVEDRTAGTRLQPHRVHRPVIGPCHRRLYRLPASHPPGAGLPGPEAGRGSSSNRLTAIFCAVALLYGQVLSHAPATRRMSATATTPSPGPTRPGEDVVTAPTGAATTIATPPPAGLPTARPDPARPGGRSEARTPPTTAPSTPACRPSPAR